MKRHTFVMAFSGVMMGMGTVMLLHNAIAFGLMYLIMGVIWFDGFCTRLDGNKGWLEQQDIDKKNKKLAKAVSK